MKLDAKSDELAFELNLIAQRTYIKSVVRKYCQRWYWDWIEDLVQDVCIKALLNRSNFDPKKGRLTTWLYTIAKNTTLDFQEKSVMRLTASGLPELEVKSVQNDFEQIDLKDNLERAFSLLDSRERDLVMHRDYLGYTGREVSEKMGIPENQVAVYLSRARFKLRKQL